LTLYAHLLYVFIFYASFTLTYRIIIGYARKLSGGAFEADSAVNTASC